MKNENMFVAVDSEVTANMETRRQQRSQLSAVTYELYKEKHVLRQMRGRRLDDHAPAKYTTTSDPDHPVAVDDVKRGPSVGEQEKHSLIQHLQVSVCLSVCLSVCVCG